MPIRRAPRVGMPVTVVFLGRRVGASVEEVDEDGRRLVVVTDEGEAIAFTLRPATGRFAGEGGAALVFSDD
jgi:hypothetical protein